nr:hypothetical protein [Tanacetum cinerariifolium]
MAQHCGYVLKLPVETPENPFVVPANIQTIKAFMNRVGYQGVVDKKFPNISKRLEEDYHSIKDDVPLVNVYTTGNVLVRGMLIPDAFLTEEIRETNDFKEYETVFMKVDVPMKQPQPVFFTQGTHRSTPRAIRSSSVSASPHERKKRKQIAGDSSSPRKSLKPGSHKDNPKVVDDDDDYEKEKVKKNKDDEMGSLKIRIEETQTTIPTPPSSPRKFLSSAKHID